MINIATNGEALTTVVLFSQFLFLSL